MIELLRARQMSRRTEGAYLMWCRQFVEFHGQRPPGRMGALEISSFLNHLANARGISASTQNQALSALIFLYREVLDRDPGELTGLARVARRRRAGFSLPTWRRPSRRARRSPARSRRP